MRSVLGSCIVSAFHFVSSKLGRVNWLCAVQIEELVGGNAWIIRTKKDNARVLVQFVLLIAQIPFFPLARIFPANLKI